MPFHLPYHHQHTLSDPEANRDNYYSPANAIYAANQTLSSVGAPIAHYPEHHDPQNSLATASEPRPYHPQSQPVANENGNVIPYRPGPAPSSYQSVQEVQPGQQQSGLRRSLTVGRQTGDELHLSQQGTAMSDVHHYGAPPAYAGEGLSIKIDPSTPQHSNSAAGQPVPGTLQPGGLPSRPAPLGASSAAPSMPTLPQISTQMQQPPLSARPMTLNHTHSYSRSSPGVMDQPKYNPFSNTPEQSKYPAGSSSYMPQTPLGPSSYSPLGLADIRQRTDPAFSEVPFSPGLAQETDVTPYPQNSNYNAPWPIYALDWCKWPPRQGNGSSGKVAIGSYMEDNHNYVSSRPAKLSDVHGN
jgi:DDB1- and CUL4-associated factor 7